MKVSTGKMCVIGYVLCVMAFIAGACVITGVDVCQNHQAYVSVYMGDSQMPIPSGSGFYFRDGYVVTAAHVVQGQTMVKIDYPDGSFERSEDITVSDKYDVAFIKVKRKLSNLKVRLVEDIVVNREVECYSSPLHWRFIKTIGYVVSVEDYTNSWEGDITLRMDIMKGSSGGAVYQDKELIGLVSRFFTDRFNTMEIIVSAEAIQNEFNRLVKKVR